MINTEPGYLYTWGGVAFGENGDPTKPDREGVVAFPSRVPTIRNAVQVSCGDNSTAVVTSEGTLYTFGSGRGGRLGHGSESNEPVPRAVDAFRGRPVLQVAAGQTHMLAVLRDGTVWGWGKGHSHAFGKDISSRSTPAPILSANGQPMEGACYVAAGHQNSAAILRSGGVLLMWGDNSHGKCGVGAKGNVPVPTEVVVGGSGVVNVCLGSMYSGCVTANGEVWTWGFGGAGNLGIGSRASHDLPQRVILPEGEHAVHVACTVGQITIQTHDVEGKENPHTFIVTRSGSVYSMGTCHKGILGNHRTKILAPKGRDELVPYRIGSAARDEPKLGPTNYLTGEVAVKAVSSSIHSAVLTSGGALYTFGCGSTGRMGIRKFMEGLQGGRSRMKCYVSVPTAIETFVENQLRVLDVASSRRHMAAVVTQSAEPVPHSLSAIMNEDGDLSGQDEELNDGEEKP